MLLADIFQAFSSIQLILVFFLVLLTTKLWLTKYGQSKNLPPGPLTNWLPVIGSLPMIFSKHGHLTLDGMAEKYGKIFRLQLGSTTLIIITDHKLLQQTFNREVMNRRNMPVMLDVMDGMGIIHASGEMWKSQRHFVHQVLRSVGMVRTTTNRIKFEEKASAAINIFLQELENTKGQSIDIFDALSYTLSNIFFSSIIGKTFDRDNQELKDLIARNHDSFRIMESISIANFLPILARLPKFKRILRTIFDRRELCFQYFRTFVEEHRKDFDPDQPRDLIDAYLLEMEKDKSEGRISFFTETQLLSILGDLFSAGLETTLASIQWLLLALITYPEIQSRIHNELDSIIGRERCPSLDDRQHLKYLEATIQEGFRFATILPMGLGHNPVEDTTIAGYHIPRDATVVGLLWKFHRNPTLWKNPEVFDPNNMLNEDGSLNKPRHLMPFSSGRRICLGEDVAQNEIFLILANLLHKFEIVGEEGLSKVPRMDDCVMGILRVPLPFLIRAIPRNS